MTDIEIKAGRKEWIGLAVLVLPTLLVSMDMTVLLYAIPFISGELEPSPSELLWIMDIYPFVLAGLLVTMGSLGDRIGRRRLLLIGAALFGGASVIAAYADSPAMLIVARALLGVGGATLAPSTLALIRNLFHDDEQRQTAIGVWTAGFTGGSVLGPILGGLLLQNFHWGTVFLINVPVMLILLVAGVLILPESKNPQAGKLDLISSALSLLAILPIIYGIKKIAQDGVAWQPVVAIVAGLVIGVLFVRRQWGLAEPMIDVRLFSTPPFATALLTNTMVVFALVGSMLFTSQYLQMVLGMQPFNAALWSLITGFAMTAGAVLAAVFQKAMRPSVVIGAGLLIGAAGLLLITRAGTDSLALVLIGNSVAAFGIGVVSALATGMVLSVAPPERAGAASALQETSTELGGALSIAIMGTAGMSVYHSEVKSLLPPGLDSGIAASAQSTIGAAVVEADKLGGQLGAEVLNAARMAFTTGMHMAVTVGAVILVGIAILAMVRLRDVSAPPASEPEQKPLAQVEIPAPVGADEQKSI